MDSSQTLGVVSSTVVSLSWVGQACPSLPVKLIFTGFTFVSLILWMAPLLWGPVLWYRLLFVDYSGCKALLSSNSNLHRGCFGDGKGSRQIISKGKKMLPKAHGSLCSLFEDS